MTVWNCLTCSEGNEGEGESCWNCGTSRFTAYGHPPEPYIPPSERTSGPKARLSPAPKTLRLPDGFILSTTPSLETHQIVAYLNVVTGETFQGVNALVDLVAGFRDMVGGRSATYEYYVQQARETALAEMVQKAIVLEAHGIVGVMFATQIIETSMLMVSCWGTAVRLKPRAAQP